MTSLSKVIIDTEDFTAEKLSDNVKAWITSQELGFGKVMQPLRLSLVGSMSGPDVFVIAATIGKEKTLERIRFAIEKL